MTKLIKNVGIRVFGINAIAYGLHVAVNGLTMQTFTMLTIYTIVALFTSVAEIKDYMKNKEEISIKIKTKIFFKS